MIALIDYGIGNLRSVEKALSTAAAMNRSQMSLVAPETGEQEEVIPISITSAPEVILAAQKVVLPGVGAFGDGMAGLRARGLAEVVLEVIRRGTPLLGICVGMQLLFEVGEEMGEHRGLGLLPGRVRRFPSPILVEMGESNSLPPAPDSSVEERLEMRGTLKIPQTGWNQLQVERPNPLLAGLPPASYAYFNHSYYCDAAEPGDILASTWYGMRYPCVVGRGRLYGVQFHPEKSQAVGLLLLRNFLQNG